MARRWMLGIVGGSVAASIAGLVGCSIGNGLADNGEFDYVCTSTGGDPACARSLIVTHPSTPDSIALGARFRLKFIDSTEDSTTTIEAVSPDAVEVDKGNFVTRRPGRVGFMVKDGDVVVDAIRLRVVSPHHIRLRQYEGGLPGDLNRPETLIVRNGARFAADAEDDNDIPIAGTMPATWGIDDPTVATVVQRDDGTCAITVVAPGRETWLRATVHSLQAATRIRTDELVDAPNANSQSDAGSDAATDADADVDEGGVQ